MITLKKINSVADVQELESSWYERGNFIVIRDKDDRRSLGIVVTYSLGVSRLVNEQFIAWSRVGGGNLRNTVKFLLERLEENFELYILHIEIPAR